MNAENAKNGLIAHFPDLAERTRVQREKRLYTTVEYARFREVFNYAIDELHFLILCTITGLDDGERIAFIYHLADETGTIMNIQTSIPKQDPVLATVMDRFPAAEIYERELIDLLGVKVPELPAGKRYPLPDNWPANEYPLRKDWKAKATQ
jgi:membrane-bound hydrogenase subunit beta